MQLKELVPQHLAYCLSKLYEGYWSGYPLAESNLRIIVGYQAKIKEYLNNKYGSYKKIDSISDELESIDYILLRLQEVFDRNNIKGNKDAKVFIDGLGNYFETVKEMFEEIDSTGWHPDNSA